MSQKVYLDYASTTPMHEDVKETLYKAQDIFYANPEALYDAGYSASRLVQDATKQMAKQLDVFPGEIYYTSGATESNNMAIFGVAEAYKDRGKHLITTAIEHSSSLEAFKELEKRGYNVTFLNVDTNGLFDIEQLLQEVTKETLLVSLIHVHNELGTIQPVEQVAKQLKEKHPQLIIHVDMAQSVGKVPIDLSAIDMATFSGHKFYGPKGIGILMKKMNIQLQPLLFGGEQQQGLRPGTQDAALIAATSKAFRIANDAREDNYEHVAKISSELREYLRSKSYINLTIDETIATPYIIHYWLDDTATEIETYLHALSEKGIYVATRSTCHSKSVYEPNAVLVAIGLTPDESRRGMRISLSARTTEDEVAYFKTALDEIETKLHFR